MKNILFMLTLIYATHTIATEPKNEYIETGIKFFFAGAKATVNTVKNAKNTVSNTIEGLFNNLSNQQHISIDPYTGTEIVTENKTIDTKTIDATSKDDDFSNKEITNNTTHNDTNDSASNNAQPTKSIYKYAPQTIGITAIIAATVYYYKKPIINGILKIKRKIIDYFS